MGRQMDREGHLLEQAIPKSSGLEAATPLGTAASETEDFFDRQPNATLRNAVGLALTHCRDGFGAAG